jgi:hypothetical protein
LDLTVFDFSNGKTLPSFFIKTTDSAARRLNKAAVSGVLRVVSGAFSGTPEQAHSFTKFNTFLAQSSSAFGSSLFVAAASARASPLHLDGPGISKSKPAFTASEVEYVPNLPHISTNSAILMNKLTNHS